MKHLITLIFIALAVSASAQTRSIQKSDPLSSAPPESAGMSAERLNRIDAMCKASVKDGDVPGIVFLDRSDVQDGHCSFSDKLEKCIPIHRFHPLSAL